MAASPGAHAVPPPTSIEQVLSTIQGALSYVNEVRMPAEKLLAAWEADAAPGFITGLLKIVEQHGTVDEVRLERQIQRMMLHQQRPTVVFKRSQVRKVVLENAII